ncbi:MAG: ATP-binding protein [Candidatus Hodarchaeota archaeon]
MKIDENKCVGYGICVEKCPIEAISLINGKTIDVENKCNGCGVCVHHCPENARSLVRTELREVYLPPLIIKEESSQ